MRAWRMAMRVGSGGVSMWPRCKEKGIAAITYLPVSRTDLTPYPDTASPDGWSKMEIPQRTSLKRFAWGIEGGDIIFVKEGPQLVGRCIVKGEIGLRAYEYRPDFELVEPFLCRAVCPCCPQRGRQGRRPAPPCAI